MPKHLIKRLYPQSERVKNSRWMGIFGHASRDPNLWHINRKSVARAVAVGLFSAFIPFPIQMILAAGLAIIFRANIPISVTVVWVSNPLTIPALFYFAYILGALLLDVHLEPFQFEFSLNWLFTELQDRWQPFLLGCLCAAALASASGYAIVTIYWKIYIAKVWRNRKSHARNKTR